MIPRFIATVCTALLAFALLGAGPPDPFSGAWEGTDVVDESSLRLSLGGGGETRSVSLFDDDATVACDTGGPATARGTGVIDGNDLVVDEFVIRCADGTPTFVVEASFTYDPSTDTLIDNVDCTATECTVYTRPGA